jgi:predicted alpha/beta-hydrolase family hydrolase
VVVCSSSGGFFDTVWRLARRTLLRHNGRATKEARPVETLRIQVDHPSIDSVAGLWQAPAGAPRATLLLAHGAGAGMRHPFLEDVARGLCDAGFALLRFQYPYMERAEADGTAHPPDPMPRLEAAHTAALAEAERRAGGRVLMAGKSMGGRVASQLAAKGHDCTGLVFFGYPLHAPGRTDRPRSEHFAAICQPALFLQGTRDTLCDLELLRNALRRFGGSATLEVVADADHSFSVRKRETGQTRADVIADLVGRVVRWERGAFP